MKNNPQNRQAWILEELKKSPLLSYGDMFAKYSLNFAKTKRTFDKDWKQAKEELQIYQNKIQTEKEKVSIEIEKEAVKQGLKTKIDRLFILQNQVEDILERLKNGKHTQEVYRDGKVSKYERFLTPKEVAGYNKTLKELQSEISKMEGDYAVIQQEMEIKSNIDFTKVSNKTLEEIAKARL